MIYAILSFVTFAAIIVFGKIKLDFYTRTAMEDYVASRNPKSVADVENYIRLYQHKTMSQ